MDYINDLMSNHPLETETEYSLEEYDNDQTGGSKDKPDAGFPPIYLCEKADQEMTIFNKTQEQKKQYGKEGEKNVVSIQKILEKRKGKADEEEEESPFISL